MTTHRSYLARIVALAGVSLLCSSGLFAKPIPVLVIAENYDSAQMFATTPERPLRCKLVDAGGMIAGDPVAGDSAQDARRVAQAVAEAVGGPFTLSNAGDRDLDIVYHWGLLRPVRFEHAPADGIDPNFKARLLLVARPERVTEIENAFVHRRMAGASLSSVIESEIWADTLAHAAHARYFVILSAYDHAAMVQGQTKLVWRTRVSTPENSGPMNDVLVTLARASRTFLAADRKQPKTVRVPLETGALASDVQGSRSPGSSSLDVAPSDDASLAAAGVAGRTVAGL